MDGRGGGEIGYLQRCNQIHGLQLLCLFDSMCNISDYKSLVCISLFRYSRSLRASA